MYNLILLSTNITYHLTYKSLRQVIKTNRIKKRIKVNYEVIQE